MNKEILNILFLYFKIGLAVYTINSERMFFFCVSVYTRTYRNNASGFNFSSFSDFKVNLVGALGRSFFHSFQKHQKKPKKKITEKREFLRKTRFRPNRFFYMVVIQKLITCR
ncbi:Uncharacterized protein FWK35_00006954, partial [Aphis craccivora]